MAAAWRPNTIRKRKRSSTTDGYRRSAGDVLLLQRHDVVRIAGEALLRVRPHEVLVLHLQVEEALVVLVGAGVGRELQPTGVPLVDVLQCRHEVVAVEVVADRLGGGGEEQPGR